MSSPFQLSHHDSVSLIEVDDASKNKKRWDKAFHKFRCLRAFASDFLTKNTNTLSDFSNQTKLQGLNQVVKEKDLRRLNQFGGIKGLTFSLETDWENGITGDDNDVSLRQEMYGANTYKKPPSRSFFYFVWEDFKEPNVLILLVTAALSLGFQIKANGFKEGWHIGGTIIFANFLNIIVSGITKFRLNREFLKLSKVSNDIMVDVVRSKRPMQISIFKIVVGDVVGLKNGDQVPADGVFISGYWLKVDESSITGKSEHVEINSDGNLFLLSGTKVVDGSGKMLVTSVGMNTTWGEKMSRISRDADEETPLQTRLNKLTLLLGIVGSVLSFIVLIVLLIRYFTGNTKYDNGNPKYIGNQTKTFDIIFSVVEIIVPIGTAIVLALPETRPLAVTLSFTCLMKHMMVDKAMVRKLSACETMGSATVICTDKTGTLTLTEMKVTEFWLGKEKKQDTSSILPGLLELLHQGVGLNTTGTVYKVSSGADFEFSGSPTEKAILSWAVMKRNLDTERVKQMYDVVYAKAFNSTNKRSGVAVTKRGDTIMNVHWKGAAEMILAMCSGYFDASKDIRPLDDASRKDFEYIITGMAAKSLRCIAFAHKQYSDTGNENPGNEIEDTNLTLLGIVGIKDTCRPGIKNIVKACQNANVNIKLITGDSVVMARAIATECGILEDDTCIDDSVTEGADFSNLTDEERLEKVNNICVMAKSSPSDKLLMVQTLRKNHIVAVTGDMTNDALALKEANIGLSMGIQHSELENESSDIVILDKSFESVASVLNWGRWFNTNMQKFIQFQLTVYVTVQSITTIVAVLAGEFPMTTIQMLWVDLIIDTFAALALVTEKPTEELIPKPPVDIEEPLITNIMWRNILFQALYQIVVLLTLQFQGKSIFKISKAVNNTLIFNTFVLCQVFNQFNARKLEKRNVFEGIHHNKWFNWLVGVTIVLQVVMVEVLNTFANTKKLNWGQWGVCVGFALMTWPIGWVVKYVPMPQEPFINYLRRRASFFSQQRLF